MIEVLRSAIAYLLLLAVSRLVGRKAISQMTFFDYTVAITFGSLAASLALGGNYTSLDAGVAIVTFGALAILTSFLLLKSLALRKIVNSVPVVVIARGEIVRESLKRIRLTTGMLMSLLREKNAFNIADVEYAIMETDGKLSVLPKSGKQPLTPSHMHIVTPWAGLAVELIIDGAVRRDNLVLVNRNEDWLMDELHKRNITDARGVCLAALDSSGALYVTLGSPGASAKDRSGLGC